MATKYLSEIGTKYDRNISHISLPAVSGKAILENVVEIIYSTYVLERVETVGYSINVNWF